MTSRYKILFAIDILNDYYQDGRCLDFILKPSAETYPLLKKYGLLYKQVANKLVVLAKVDYTGVPVININTGDKFVFYLNLQNPVFLNFTNVDLSALRSKRFWFTNINQNKPNDLFNISVKIPKYEDATAYKPGDFAASDIDADGIDEVFECIKATQGNDTTSTFWLSRDNTQFVSLADMIVPSTKIFNYTAPAAVTEFVIHVFALNRTIGDFTELIKTETKQFDEANKNIQIDLSTMKSGKYRITINGEELLLYLDDALIYGGFLGIVEMYAHLPNDNKYAFFEDIPDYDNTASYTIRDLVVDGSGNIFECIEDTTGNAPPATAFWLLRQGVPGAIKEITYTIHFANRRAFWKYITAYQKVDNIKVKGTHDPPVTPFDSFSTDPAGHPARKDFFISELQLLMSEKADENNFELMLASPLSSFNPAAPKPDPSVTGMLTQDKDKNYFCNIRLNY